MHMGQNSVILFDLKKNSQNINQESYNDYETLIKVWNLLKDPFLPFLLFFASLFLIITLDIGEMILAYWLINNEKKMLLGPTSQIFRFHQNKKKMSL